MYIKILVVWTSWGRWRWSYWCCFEAWRNGNDFFPFFFSDKNHQTSNYGFEKTCAQYFTPSITKSCPIIFLSFSLLVITDKNHFLRLFFSKAVLKMPNPSSAARIISTHFQLIIIYQIIPTNHLYQCKYIQRNHLQTILVIVITTHNFYSFLILGSSSKPRPQLSQYHHIHHHNHQYPFALRLARWFPTHNKEAIANNNNKNARRGLLFLQSIHQDHCQGNPLHSQLLLSWVLRHPQRSPWGEEKEAHLKRWQKAVYLRRSVNRRQPQQQPHHELHIWLGQVLQVGRRDYVYLWGWGVVVAKKLQQ